MPSSNKVVTPCVRVCRPVVPGGPCAGCMRTKKEIISWFKMTDSEREHVMQELPNRIRAHAAALRAGRTGNTKDVDVT